LRISVDILYAQLCVFDPSLDRPYNTWTHEHVLQGFSWRDGSVSFATQCESPDAEIDVKTSGSPPELSGARTAIIVPFTVPIHGVVEIGSVMAGEQIAVPAGRYALHFVEYGGADAPAFALSFIPADDVVPEIVVPSETASRRAEYLMTAEPA